MAKFKGKKVLVVGFGVTGVAVARYMVKQGAKVAVSDIKQRNELNTSLKETQDLNIEHDFGRHSQKYFHTSDLIVVSPGVPLNIRPLEEARERGIPITTEVELAASAIQQPLIAITGTNGKTTTATVLGEMFKADGKKVFVGGNIGKPLIDYVSEGQNADFVIAELSSFQLDSAPKIVPAAAIFTNIDQDHLDRYPNMDSYISAKKNLLKACDRNSYVILNYDDPVVRSFSYENSGKVLWFLKQNPMDVGGSFAEEFSGAYFKPQSKEIFGKFSPKEETYDISRLRLFGDHNRENVMAAICAARAMGVSTKAVQQVIQTFEGVPHRLEYIRQKDGIFFINDSKATNVASLQAFKKNPIILIAGGRDKDMDFTPLVDLVHDRCKILILIGEAKEKINRAIGDFAETYLVGTFEEAILVAYQKSRNGDIILLSPGCSSQDMFRNYEERGDYFRKLVTQL